MVWLGRLLATPLLECRFQLRGCAFGQLVCASRFDRSSASLGQLVAQRSISASWHGRSSIGLVRSAAAASSSQCRLWAWPARSTASLFSASICAATRRIAAASRRCSCARGSARYASSDVIAVGSDACGFDGSRRASARQYVVSSPSERSGVSRREFREHTIGRAEVAFADARLRGGQRAPATRVAAPAP